MNAWSDVGELDVELGDRIIRTATTVAVVVVAAIAAVVSFVHIEHLAVRHGQSRLSALLLPLSIDGTVAAASLVMLRAARSGLPIPWLGRFMLTLSVAATLAANIGYGMPFGLSGALISGWPASSSAPSRWSSAWSVAPARGRTQRGCSLLGPRRVSSMTIAMLATSRAMSARAYSRWRRLPGS
jgi:hypothetical protein